MSDRHAVGRRSFLRAVAGAAAGIVAASRRSFGQADQGIGGTGAAPSIDPHGDQGIGGTGVIGTIRKFGSIVVNDIRIAYPPNVEVTVDGQRGTASDLKLGQVVRVVAVQRDKVWSTRSIAVTSEVVGSIETVTPKTMTVLGQTVSLEKVADTANFTKGQHVGVSGLRRTDGTIVASLIEPRSAGINQVAGPVVRGNDGIPTIGRLRLSGLDPSKVGGRTLVQGTPDAGGLTVATARTERELLGPGVSRLSIEGYVERRGSLLRLGSGLVVNAPAKIPGGSPARAVVTTTIDRGGRLTLESIRKSPEKRTDTGGKPSAEEPTTLVPKKPGSKKAAPKRSARKPPALDFDRSGIGDLNRDGIAGRHPADADRGRSGGGRSRGPSRGSGGFPHGGRR